MKAINTFVNCISMVVAVFLWGWFLKPPFSTPEAIIGEDCEVWTGG
jgi:hypothetical protein